MDIELSFLLDPQEAAVVNEFESTLVAHKDEGLYIKKAHELESFINAQDGALKAALKSIFFSFKNYRSTQRILNNMVARGASEAEQRICFTNAFNACQEQLDAGILAKNKYFSENNIRWSSAENKFLIGDSHASSNLSDQEQNADSDSVESLDLGDNQSLSESVHSQNQQSQESTSNREQEILQQPAQKTGPNISTNTANRAESQSSASDIVISNKNNNFTLEFSANLANLPFKQKIVDRLSCNTKLIGRLNSNKRWYIGLEAEFCLSLGEKKEISNFNVSGTFKNVNLGFSVQGDKQYNFELGIQSSDFFATDNCFRAIIQKPLFSERKSTSLITTVKLKSVKVIFPSNDQLSCIVFRPTAEIKMSMSKKDIIAKQFGNVDEIVLMKLVNPDKKMENRLETNFLNNKSNVDKLNTFPISQVYVVAEPDSAFKAYTNQVNFSLASAWLTVYASVAATIVLGVFHFFKKYRKSDEFIE